MHLLATYLSSQISCPIFHWSFVCVLWDLESIYSLTIIQALHLILGRAGGLQKIHKMCIILEFHFLQIF